MEPRLCGKCVEHSQQEDLFPDRIWTVHDITLTASYCPYCAILWVSLKTIFEHDPLFHSRERSNQDTIKVLEPFGVEGGSSARRCVLYRYAGTEECFEFNIFRVPQQDNLPQANTTLSFLHKRIPTCFILPSSTQSQETISQTNLWLKNCLETHQLNCSPLSEEQEWQPKRLLRVRKSESTYNVQLVELEDGAEVEYFCLSHRWGVGQAHFITTRANLAERKYAIPWDDLPNLFRQALKFTHLLGAEYLWIDSLCIIQGDHLDWSQESKKMAGIYQNAKLTLAASWAKNSNEDMFSSPKESVLGIRVKGLERVGVVDDIFVRVLLPHRLERFPLLRRAWVYQERLLSPRYLHFSPVELIWECNTEIFCQCSGKDVTSERGLGEMVEGRFAKESFWGRIKWDKEKKAFRLRSKASTWNMIVEEHSSHGITYQQDKLPAIAGMAKKFRQLGQDSKYLAGLWENTFVENLVWQASSRSANMPRSAEWIAPTWSWASAGAGVRYFGQPWVDLEVSSRIKLLDAFCEPVHEDDTMNLKSASMTIRGPTFTAIVQRQNSDDGQAKYDLEKDGVKSDKFHVDYDLSEPGAFQVNSGSLVLCMEAGNVTIYGYDGFGMHALVFRRLSNGKYDRIGVVEWDEDIRKVSNIAEIATIVVV